MTEAPNNRVPKPAPKSMGVTPPPTAKRAQPNEAFDKEVDEELQREQIGQLWEKYSGYILAGAVAIVLGVGGYKFMESRRLAAQEAEGVRYTTAVRQLVEGKADAATPSLQAVANSGSGFAALAQLRLAGADVAAGKTADAVAKFDTVTRLGGVDPMLADFARLQSAMLQLDTAPWGDIQARVLTLTAENNPWRYAARELLGMAALKANNRAEARKQFETLISDAGVPAGMAERARIVMGSLTAAELAEKAPVAPEAPKGETPKAEAPKAPAPEAVPAAPAPAPAGGPPAKKK
jgi:hypothetical protein